VGKVTEKEAKSPWNLLPSQLSLAVTGVVTVLARAIVSTALPAAVPQEPNKWMLQTLEVTAAAAMIHQQTKVVVVVVPR
jgi:hypothetical protein